MDPMGIRARLERRREDERTEAEGAARADDNLTRLRAEDPDAARVLTVTFTAARGSRRVQDQLVEQLQQYAVLKHRAGRMDLYNAIFA